VEVVLLVFFPVPGACACCCEEDCCCCGSVDFGGPPPKAFEKDVERLARPPLPPTSVREIALLSRALVLRRSLPVRGPSVVLRISSSRNYNVEVKEVEAVGLKKRSKVLINLTKKLIIRMFKVTLFTVIASSFALQHVK